MRKNLINKLWKDPVMSKVIAAGIIFVIGNIIVWTVAFFNSLNIKQTYLKVFDFLNSTYPLKIWIFVIFVILILLLSAHWIRKTVFFRKKLLPDNPQKEYLMPTSISVKSTVFFHQRFCNAFPGLSNEYKEFTTHGSINNRLETLLQKPIQFDYEQGGELGFDIKPIWWFRDYTTEQIVDFKNIGRRKYLINNHELKINKVIAYKGNSYFRDFVYIECDAEKSIGLYNHNQLVLESFLNENKIYSEEYGIFQGRLITLKEIDDGSTIINGKPVKLNNVDQRIRYLTKHNFIIAAKFSPYNCDEFHRLSGEYFGKLLKREIDFNEFIRWINQFEKNTNDN